MNLPKTFSLEDLIKYDMLRHSVFKRGNFVYIDKNLELINTNFEYQGLLNGISVRWGWLSTALCNLESAINWCNKNSTWKHIYKIKESGCSLVATNKKGGFVTIIDTKCPKCGGTGNKSMGIIPFVPCDCKTKP